jgi:hypothetical protein
LVVLSASGDPPKPTFPPFDLSLTAAQTTAAAEASAATDEAAAPVKEQAFVGANECFICHRPHTDAWSETKHPNAYTDLPKQYQNDPACLTCHVTGFGKQGGFVSGTEKDLLMVGCEACHGPGARHVDAAQRFVMANPGEEAQIEKEMRETIVKTPSDTICTSCHTTQAHGHHPSFEGQSIRSASRSSAVPCCPSMPAAKISGTNSALHGHASRYNVKTCGGCHYDQYKHWRVEQHSILAATLPANYANDKSCQACHTSDGANVGSLTSTTNGQHHRVGASCESCHGPALEHVLFNKRFITTAPLGPKLEQAARDSIRKGKPNTSCIQCHVSHGHKEHPPFEKPSSP